MFPRHAHGMLQGMNEASDRRGDARPGLRVAVVTETYPPEVNGVAMTIGCIVAGLRRRGHRVTVIRPRQGEEAPHGEDILVPGVPLPGYPGLRFGLPARGRLLGLWRAAPPHVVQVVTEGPLGWSAVGAARTLRLPVVSDLHTRFDSYSGHYGAGWLRPPVAAYLRRFHNRAGFTLVPTERLRACLLADGYRDLRVLSRGVDTRLFHPGRRCPELRRAWGLGENGLAVLHVGRMAPEKNIELVLRAFEALRERRPDARLVLVGDGPLRRRLQQRHPQHVHAGMRRGEDLARHYASADLFLFASLTETYGNVVAEALASGLAVLAYDDAAAAELIDDGRNGLLAVPGDEFGFIQAARSLAEDAQRLGALRSRASASVADRDWERIHDTCQSLLHEAVREHSRRGGAGPARATAPD